MTSVAHVIRHDAPLDEPIAIPVAVEKCSLNEPGDLRPLQVAGAVPGVLEAADEARKPGGAQPVRSGGRCSVLDRPVPFGAPPLQQGCGHAVGETETDRLNGLRVIEVRMVTA